MKICFPFNQSPQQLHTNAQSKPGGYYPVGANNFWHGGIHLFGTDAITAIADGEIVAFRMNEKYRLDAPPPQSITQGEYDTALSKDSIISDIYELLKNQENYTLKAGWDSSKTEDLNSIFNLKYSSNFVLVKHSHTLTNKASGDETQLSYYSTYMHLLPSSEYTDSTILPLFMRNNRYLVKANTHGNGLKLLSEDDTESVSGIETGKSTGIVPQNSTVEWFEQEEKEIFRANPTLWSFVHPDSHIYVYSPALDTYGFIPFSTTTMADAGTSTSGNPLYKVISNTDTAEPTSTGINGYNSEIIASALVSKVIPKESVLIFEDATPFLKGDASTTSVLKVVSWKHPDTDITTVENALFIEVTKSDITTQEISPFTPNTIVIPDTPIPVQGGDILGHPGKYHTQDNMLHLEVFSDSKTFIDAFTDDGDRNWQSAFTPLETDTDTDTICDIKPFIKEIEAMAATNTPPASKNINTKKNILEPEELEAAMKDSDFAEKMRKQVVLHPSEWSTVHIDSTLQKLKKKFKFKQDQLDSIKIHIEQLAWWEQVKAKHTDLPDSKNIFSFHPIQFLEHLQKFSMDMELTVAYDNSSALAPTPVDLIYSNNGRLHYQLQGGTLDSTGKISVPNVMPGAYYWSLPELWNSSSIALIDTNAYYKYRIQDGDSTESIAQHYMYTEDVWNGFDIFIDSATTPFGTKVWSATLIDTAHSGHFLYIPCHVAVKTGVQTLTITPKISLFYLPKRSALKKAWDLTIEDRSTDCSACYRVSASPANTPVTYTSELLNTGTSSITNIMGAGVPLSDSLFCIKWDGKNGPTNATADTYKLKLTAQLNIGSAPTAESESADIKVIRVGITGLEFKNSYPLKFHDDIHNSPESINRSSYNEDIPTVQWKLSALDASPGVLKTEPDLCMEVLGKDASKLSNSDATNYSYPVCYKRGEAYTMGVTLAGQNFDATDNIRVTTWHIPDEIPEALFQTQVVDKIHTIHDQHSGSVKTKKVDAQKKIQDAYTLVNAKKNKAGSTIEKKYVLKGSLATSDIDELLDILSQCAISVFSSASAANEKVTLTSTPNFETTNINALVNRTTLMKNYALFFKFEYEDSGTWHLIGQQKTRNHAFVTIIDKPEEPWGAGYERPWVSALTSMCDPITGWIADADDEIKDEDWVSGVLVEKFYLSGLTYDNAGGASEYTSGPNQENGKIKSALNYFSGKPITLHEGNIVNCTDCGTIISSLANVIGCKLWSSRFYKKDSKFLLFTSGHREFDSWFECNEIMSIQGGPPTIWAPPFPPGNGFSYHEIAFKGGATSTDIIYDACLKVADNPVTSPRNDIYCENMIYTDYEKRICKNPTLTDAKPTDSVPVWEQSSTGWAPSTTYANLNYTWRVRRTPV